MGLSFLFGGMSADFGELSGVFVAAAGGAAARIALLVGRHEAGERDLPRFQEAWQRLGPRIDPVAPEPGDQTLSPAALRTIAGSTGIFVCGGDTRLYHHLYAVGPGRAAILKRIAAGAPYAGSSAGALIATEAALVWGDRVRRDGQVLYVGGAEGPCEADVDIQPGLALVPRAIMEAHFTAQGGFPRLLAALDASGMRYGLGVDDGICLEIRDGTALRVRGSGRLYMLERTDSGQVVARALLPGSAEDLHRPRN